MVSRQWLLYPISTPNTGCHSPVYFYEFQHRPSFFQDTKPPHVKADHGDEVLLIFRNFFRATQGESFSFL